MEEGKKNHKRGKDRITSPLKESRLFSVPSRPLGKDRKKYKRGQDIITHAFKEKAKIKKKKEEGLKKRISDPLIEFLSQKPLKK